MEKLAREQRRLLADFCSNFAIAWFAAGLVAPIFTGKSFEEINKSVIAAIVLGGVFLLIGVSLIKEGARK